jgi:hypothetical protein
MATWSAFGIALMSALSVLVPTAARAAEVEGGVTVGWQIAEAEDEKAKGLSVAAGMGAAVGHIGTARTIVNGEATYWTLGYSAGGLDVDINALSFGGRFTLGLPLTKRLDLDLGIAYDFALAGTVKWSGGTAGGDKKDMKDTQRLHHAWGLAYEIGGGNVLGLGLDWYTTAVHAKDADGDIDVKAMTIAANLTKRI